jgi:hypothetical protein
MLLRMGRHLGFVAAFGAAFVGACGTTITIEESGTTASSGTGATKSSGAVSGTTSGAAGGGSITSASSGAGTGGATSTTASSSSSSGAGGASDITGTMVYRYYGETAGPLDVPANLLGSEVSAFVWTGSAWTTYPGGGDSSGNFTIPAVPAGPCMVDVAGQYVYTAARVLDLGSEVNGRPTAVYGKANNAATGTLQGLAAWQVDDILEWHAPNSAGAAYSFSGAAPATGATTLAGQLEAWQGALVDARQGDVLYATQLSAQRSGSAEYLTVTGFTAWKSVEQTDGTPIDVTGLLTTTTPAETIDVDFRGSQFMALGSAVNPAATSEGAAFAVITQPGASAAGAFGYSIELLEAGASGGDLTLSSVAYANPFDPAWGELVYAAGTWALSYTAPGASSPASQYGYVYETTPRLNAPATLVPLVSPVQKAEIGGMSATGAVTSVGVTPMLTWAPPATGVASAYHVTVYLLEDTAGATNLTYVAEIVTTTTSVPMPPALLQRGSAYAMTITAIASPLDASTQPFHGSATMASADLLTGVITP